MKTKPKYDEVEKFWYLYESEATQIFIEILVNIMRDTFGDKKDIFNAELLIRQNLLSLIETEDYMIKIFGQPYIWIKDSEDDAISLQNIKDDVIQGVMRRLELYDIDLKDEWIKI